MPRQRKTLPYIRRMALVMAMYGPKRKDGVPHDLLPLKKKMGKDRFDEALDKAFSIYRAFEIAWEEEYKRESRTLLKSRGIDFIPSAAKAKNLEKGKAGQEGDLDWKLLLNNIGEGSYRGFVPRFID